MITWPENLPCISIETTFEPVDPQIRTEMQSGRVFVRRNFTAVPVAFSARWVLKSSAEATEFNRFYQDDLKDGTLWFLMPLLQPEGDALRKVQFQGAYKYRKLGPDIWEYTANMLMFLRPAQEISAP